jgi:hypothetical protein
MDRAFARMYNLTMKAWKFSPKATIILSTLLLSDNEDESPGANERVNRLNKEIRDRKSSSFTLYRQYIAIRCAQIGLRPY